MNREKMQNWLFYGEILLAFLKISVIIEKIAHKKGYTKMQKLNEFIEKLLEEKGISIPDEEIKKQTVADMREKLEAEIDRAVITALPEEKAKDLASKIDNPDFKSEDMAKFIQDSGVDVAKITEETLERFRKLYLKGEE